MRNFTMEARVNDKESDGLRLSLVRQDGQRVSLDGFLPEGFRFIPGGRFVANIKNKTIMVPLERVGTRSDILVILHEIGHAMNSPQIAAQKKQGLDKYDEQHPGLSDPNSFIQPGILEKYQERQELAYGYDAVDERRAEAYAFRMMREMNRNGYTVFADFQSQKEAIAVSKAALATYESTRRYHLEDERLRTSPERPYLRASQFEEILDQITQASSGQSNEKHN